MRFFQLLISFNKICLCVCQYAEKQNYLKTEGSNGEKFHHLQGCRITSKEMNARGQKYPHHLPHPPNALPTSIGVVFDTALHHNFLYEDKKSEIIIKQFFDVIKIKNFEFACQILKNLHTYTKDSCVWLLFLFMKPIIAALKAMFIWYCGNLCVKKVQVSWLGSAASRYFTISL